MDRTAIQIHVISDSTGDTAARVARAASAQFAAGLVAVVKHPRMSSVSDVDGVFARLATRESEGMTVFSTMVDNRMRDTVDRHCRALDLPHCDLLGPALSAVEQASGRTAERVPARPVGVDADYFRRIAAMEFAIRHDDGAHPDELASAEVVLIGVSRSGKTPLSMYLGYLGYRTANVPLISGIAPPRALFEVDRRRIVALTIDPKRLVAIRSRRVTSISPAETLQDYADLPAIFKEIDHALQIQRTLGCPVIDTTSLALEEAARRVIELVESRSRLL